MAWYESGSDWTSKSAAELRPVIVSLCNAVGDRYECIGLNRPGWPVNLDQAIDSYTAGTKYDALVEEDLYGMEIFRFNWWGAIASTIISLVNLSAASDATVGSTHCRGWCKTASSSGLGSDVWTLEELETEVGLGEIDESLIAPGYAMHLFDEVAPNRLREILNLLIYPVIFPGNIVEYSGGFGGGTLLGLSSGAVADVEASIYKGLTTGDGDGDEAWGALAVEGFGAMNGESVGYNVEFVTAFPLTARADYCEKSYVSFDFSDVQNGVGYLGDVTRAIFAINTVGEQCSTFDITIAGATASFSAQTSTTYADQYIDAVDALYVDSPQELPFEIGNFGRTPSPGTYTYSGAGAGFPDDGYTGYGRASAIIGTMFRVGGVPRAEATRYLLDISPYCSDQI